MAAPRLPLWRWAALLGFALLGPAALPAGGAEPRLPELRRRSSSREPLLSTTCTSLRCAPHCQAPVLAQLEAGMPLRVLRRWQEPGGRAWFQVKVEAQPLLAGIRSKGWLPG